MDTAEFFGDQLRQSPSAGRFERRYPVELDRGRRFGVALEAEIDVGGEVVGSRRLSHGIRLVERHHGCPSQT